MLYLIKFQDHVAPKIVTASSLETVQKNYQGCKVYRYGETNNPVVIENTDHGLWWITRFVIPNMPYNQYCVWN